MQIGTSPLSVGVELSAVRILAWSGVGCLDFFMCRVLSQFIVQAWGGTGKTMTGLPPPLGAQHSCSPQPGSVAQPPPHAPPLPVLGSVPQPLPHAPPQPVLGSVAQPRWRVQNKCPVMHGRSACAVCAQCRRCRGLAHLVCLRQLCSQHATRCLNFLSNNLAILDFTAAHGSLCWCPCPPPPF